MDVVSLGKKRVDITRDCKDWSCLDALRQTIEDIESGVINPDMVYISMMVRNGDKDSFSYSCAGVSNIELIGLLSRHLHEMLAD